MLATMGAAWFLAAIGVFVRDIGQAIGFFTTVMMFLAPVFYPVSALPKEYQLWIHVNPLTFITEEARGVPIWGKLPHWLGLGVAVLRACSWPGPASGGSRRLAKDSPMSSESLLKKSPLPSPQVPVALPVTMGDG